MIDSNRQPWASRSRRLPLPDRFWRHVHKTALCWEWTGAKTKGYGVMGVDRTTVRAHRVSWQIHRGRIPAGLVMDHLCRNPSCVNPDHLEPVTQQENLRRGVGPTGQHFRATCCPRGHVYDEANTYYAPKTGYRTCRACRPLARAASRLTA